MHHPATIIYHGECPDGFGAAYAAWRLYGDQAAYVPMHHGEPWRTLELADRDVFILDFSFSPGELQTMAEVARSVYLLDHHASARQPWAGVLQSASDAGNLAIHRHPELSLTIAFDLDKSGARLAWEHFHPTEPLPLALAHIEDQDLWRFRLPGTRPFCRSLRLQPYDFAAWDRIVRQAVSPESPLHRDMVREGEAIERFCALEVERLGNSRLVMPVSLKGEPADPLQALRHGLPIITDSEGSWRAVSGLAINANGVFTSELGHCLAQRSGTFGLIWQLGGDGEVRVSLRACGQVDVAAMAQNYGGGGHPNAAGFRMPLRRFVDEVLNASASLPA
ncbi:MAG TPA: DHHA1 domain-containing protein [Rhodocyclaceae bacterium]|nr:DHHA1 domain-containing protein [Rhodocyclaceae bacterium]